MRRIPRALFVRTASRKETTRAIKFGSKEMSVVAVIVAILMHGQRKDFVPNTKGTAHQLILSWSKCPPLLKNRLNLSSDMLHFKSKYRV